MKELEFGENGLCKCSSCQKSIPKEIERINFVTRNRFGTAYIRICALCILKLSNKVCPNTTQIAIKEAIEAL